MSTSLARTAIMSAALTAGLLVLPLVAMPFIPEINWGAGDFIAAAVLLFSGGMAYALAARRARTALQRYAIAALVFVAVAAIWAELAVGLFT